MADKALTQSSTLFPDAPVVLKTGAKKISPTDWTGLSIDLYQMVTTAYAVRQPLERNLRDYTDLYGMDTPQKDFPYENSSNVFIPIIPSKLDALLAQVVDQTLVPEFYIVSGNTDDADQNAYKVQRYYNAEFRRQRGRSTWFDEHVKWLHLALRDGTAYMEVLWNRKKRKQKFGVHVPKVGDDGLPQFDPETGDVVTEQQDITQDVTDYDDVVMRPVLLRDLMLIPDESTNVEEAAGVARCLWLYESDCKEMIEDGLLDAEWVERALSYVPQGTSDVASDRQGTYDKSIDYQINIGQGQGALASRFFKNRGPIKVWRIHTRQFDMNEDGIVEENVFYLHELSTFMLGWCPAEYIAPSRPFFGLTPFPRPDRAYGYSLVERLAPINAEVNNIHNQRNDEITMRLSPPYLINRNEEIHDKSMQWGPGKSWAVSNVDTAVKQLQMQDIPLASWQEESLLDSYADQLSGLGGPMSGGGNSGRRSASEAKISAQATGTRSALIAMIFRISARSVIEYVHKLKQQYMPDEDKQSTAQSPARMTIDRQVLMQDYKIDVAGSSDPLDKNSHLQEVMGAYNLLSQDRDIQSDAQHRYNLKRKLLEAFGWVDIDSIIGTEDEAVQRKQGEQQAQQEQQQMQKQMADAKMFQETKGAMGQEPQQGQQPGQQQQQGQPGQGGMMQALQAMQGASG